LSNLAHQYDEEDENDFLQAQEERAARKERLRLIQGGDDGEFIDADNDSYSPADDETDNDTADNVVSLGERREKKEDSASELKKQEDTAAEDNELNFTGGKNEKRRSRLSGNRKRGIIVGCIITMLVSVLTFVFSLISGPAQLLHLSQLMDRFHFSSQEEDGSSRLFKLAKAIKNKDKPQNNRLGILGNKLADKWEAKLKDSGFTLEYNKRTGLFERFVLDPEKIAANSQVDGLGDSNPEEIQKHFKENFNIDVNVDTGGRLVVEGDNLSFFKARKLDRVMFKSANYSKAGAALRARTIGARQGLTWHPIKKLDNKLYKTLDAKYEAWKKSKAEAQENGASDATVNDPEKVAEDGKDSQQATDSNEKATETQKAANDVKNEIKTEVEAKGEVPEGGKFSGISEHLSVKSAGLASLAVGMVCLAQGLSGQIDQIQYNNVALPMMRAGMDFVASGSQIMGAMATGQSIDMDQVGFLVKRLNDDTQGGSWTNAKSIQAELGNPQTGPDVPSEARISKEGNPVTQFLNAVPGLPLICGAANSAVGQVASFGIDILTGGPFGALFGQISSRTIMPYITDSFVSVVSGEAMDVSSRGGAILGGIINWGSRLSANDAALRSGGKALSKVEALQLQERQLAIDKDDYSHMSLASRMFNLADSRSLASRFIDQQSPDVSNNLARMASSLFNIRSSLQSFGSIFQVGHAAAADDYDYGFPQIGMSATEMEDPRLDDPYANATAAQALLQNGSTRERAERCFGISISTTDQTVVSQGPAPSYADLAKPENNCSDSSFNWTRIRMYIFDVTSAEGYACLEGVDDTACANSGTGQSGDSPSAASAPDTTPTGTPELPTGSGADLAKQLLASPNVKSDHQDQLVNIAAGKGPCPSVNNGQYQVDSRLLAVLVALSKNNTFTITSLHRGCTGTTVGAGTKSRHWQGRAVDISGSRGINGATMPSFGAYDPKIQNFINQAKTLLPDGCELGVANDKYKQGALATPSACKNVFLDTTATTGATGPHVHLGV
jgi:hypothetical protein